MTIVGCTKQDPASAGDGQKFQLFVDVPAIFGSFTVNPDQALYSSGDTVVCTVVPKGTYIFRGWSGDVVDTARTVRVIMSGNKHLHADFQSMVHGPKLLLLTIRADSATVAFATTPVSIDSAAGVSIWDSGAVVTATAKPGTGDLFVRWGGDTIVNTPTITFTMTRTRSLSVKCASMSLQSIFDTVCVHIPGNGGRVSFVPHENSELIDANSGDSAYVFPHGEHITVTAQPFIDWKFVSWGGALSGSHDTAGLDLNSNCTIIGNFTKDTSTPGVVGHWKVAGWSFISSMGGPFQYTSGGDTCFLDINADGTYAGWAIHFYSVEKSSGTWTADQYYITFSSSNGWYDEVTWQVSKGTTSASLNLVASGESGQIHEMCSK